MQQSRAAEHVCRSMSVGQRLAVEAKRTWGGEWNEGKLGQEGGFCSSEAEAAGGSLQLSELMKSPPCDSAPAGELN